MYNISTSDSHGGRAWVTHGFTDSSLSSFPNGDLQWSLCVTCGAWLSSHLFDFFLYNENSARSVSTMVSIFRGLIYFFQDYLFSHNDLIDGKQQSITHSGPTTSPENSFLIKMQCPSKQFVLQLIETLSLSPSIDISILRQVSHHSPRSFSPNKL